MKVEPLSSFKTVRFTNWDQAKWWQKIIGYFSKSYKSKFLTFTLYNLKYTGNGTYEAVEDKNQTR